MLSPFPGMNPYLEHPALWREVHKQLIIAIANALNPQLRPNYRVGIKDRVYQTIDEDYLLAKTQFGQSATKGEMLDTITLSTIQAVTVKVLMPETIRESYLVVRDVTTHEVVTAVAIVSPNNNRRLQADLYTFNLQNVIPSFPLLLCKHHSEPLLDLQSILNKLYDRTPL